MKLRENLWQVGGVEYSAPEDAAVYLVALGDSAALIDAGCGNGHQRLIENISDVASASLKIEYLLLTHCHYDHTGGARALREYYGCKIVAHELDARYLERGDSTVTAASWYGARMAPLTIDYKIKVSRQSIAVGNGEIISYHVPGHTPGSVVYLVELDSSRILFGQDVHGPLDPSFLSNRRDYLRSLEFLLTLDADVLCEGHFGIFRGKEDIRRFIRSYLPP